MNAFLNTYYRDLGVDPAILTNTRHRVCEQANLQDLEVVDIDFLGRPFLLTAATATAWKKLVVAAASEHIILGPASGFRSYLYQKKMIEGKLASGLSLAQILTTNPLPGFSEHHTGRAIDIIADPAIPEEEFHLTDAYLWMQKSADRFQFRLSYPQGNSYGMIFEPWHWYFMG